MGSAASGWVQGPQRRRNVSAAVGLALLFGTSTAPAAGVSPISATPEQAAEAQRLYEQGVAEFKAGRFREAASIFDKAYEVVASPNARMMYARSLRDAGEVERAYEEFARTQQEAAELAVSAPKYASASEAAEREVLALQPRIAAIGLDIKGSKRGVSVKVGARDVPSALWTAIVVPPGTVEVQIRLPSGRRLTRSAEVKLGELVKLRVDVNDPSPASAASGPAPRNAPDTAIPEPEVSATPAEPPPPPPAHRLRPYAYVAGGIGVAGLATFAIMGSMANATYSDLENACPGNRCSDDRSSDIDRGKQQQLIANLGLALGVIGLGAGVTLFVLDSKPSSAGARPSVRLIARPTSLGLEGSF